jgi:VanZ family protein
MMKRTKARLFLCGALIAALLAFIWGNSLLPGEDSGELSGFVGTLLQTLLPFLNLQSKQGMHLLRKAAHFSEFAALGFSFSWLYGMLSKKRLWSMVLPLVSGAAAAALDETIQLFSPDRGPSIKDVGIDTAGVITGIAVLTLLHCLYKRMKKR